MARTHGTVSTYGYGCRCDLCADAQRAYHAAKKKPCPKCGVLMKHTSRLCKECNGNAGGGKHIQPHVTISMPLAAMQNPAWRPDHYPPPCPACNGFAYTLSGDQQWSRCRACKASPGHAMSHKQWTETRT